MDAKKRIIWIDYLRFLGLVLVIASHVFGTGTPFLQLLFGCNVAIMVFVSGYCSVSLSKSSVLDYYKKRGKQLIIHSWLFFAIYFGLVLLLNIGKPYPYSWSQVIKTFLFMDGIGFTWIIAVFIMIAIAMPLLAFLTKKYSWFRIAFPVAYTCIALLIFISEFDAFYIKVGLYGGGYLIIAFLGYISNIEPPSRKWIAGGSIGVCIVCMLIVLLRGGDVFDLSANKYPPTIYYVSYGVAISSLLMVVLMKAEDVLSGLKVTNAIRFVSKNSFDIYLWHVFGLYISSSFSNCWFRFIFVTVIAMVFANTYVTLKQKMFALKEKYSNG